MNLDQITNELKNLSDKINLIDNNVKFNLQMFWTVIAVIVAVLALAIYFLVKQFISYTIKNELDKRFEQIESNINSKVKEGIKRIDNEKADKSELMRYEHGIWTPTLYNTNVKTDNNYSIQIGTYIKQEHVVSINMHIKLDKKDANIFGNIKIGGLPYLSNMQTIASCAIGMCIGINTDKGQLVANVIPRDSKIVLGFINKDNFVYLTHEDILDNFTIALSATYTTLI